jgi:hypothetical protein
MSKIIKVKTQNVPAKQRPRLTNNKEYEARHIARDLFLITDNKGDNMTITMPIFGRGCHHINYRKWSEVK